MPYANMMGISTRMTLHKEYGPATQTDMQNAFTKWILLYTPLHNSVISSARLLFPTPASSLTQREAKFHASNYA